MIVNNIKKVIFLLCVFVFCTQINLFSQEKKKRTFMYLTYEKNNEGVKRLKVKLKYKENKKFFNLENAGVKFFYGEEFMEELGEIISNEEGEAVFEIKDELEPDSVGVFCFGAKYSGNEKHKKAKKEVCVKDAEIELVFNQKSESRIIHIKAHELINEGKNAINNEKIVISVPTLFGDLELGNSNIVNGSCSIEFPSDLPGDKDGFLLITAKIIDSEFYGNVYRSERVPWGMKTSYDNVNYSSEKGKLWTYNAPIWMVVTLTVLLLGVWSHFGYVIFQMYKINKEGKEIIKAEEKES